MLYVLIGLLVGTILGVLALVMTRQNAALTGWLVLGFGVIAFLAVLPSLFAVIRPVESAFNPVFSMIAGVASLVSGFGAVGSHRTRGWQVWAGIVLGAVPILFWLAFALGGVIFPS
jgi:hypothetical protein